MHTTVFTDFTPYSNVSFEINLKTIRFMMTMQGLMNSFNKTEAAVFSCRLCFLMAFTFISLIVIKQYLFKV